MTSVDKIMKGKQSFKKEMDKELSREDSDKAFEIMRVVMKEKTEKIGAMLAGMMKIPGFKSFFLKMWDTMSHKNFGPTAGFSNVFYPKEKDRFRMDITGCPYHKYLTELGCPEINILYCFSGLFLSSIHNNSHK